MIHVVSEGETIDTIANRYGVSPYDLAYDNQIEYPYPLVIGQALWVQVADDTPTVEKQFFGYAYPFITEQALYGSLPYMDSLYHFSYGYNEAGNLSLLADDNLFQAAVEENAASVLVLTPFDNGRFSNQLVNVLVENTSVQETLVNDLIAVMGERGFEGVNVDFEYILAEDKQNYVNFLQYLKGRMEPYGYQVTVALPPKIADDQPGLLYEGMDYAGIAEAVDAVFLMTYEWGYTYGPNMAVAPIPSVRRVLDYAVTRIPRDKIYMGLPNYGYDWPLPYERGVTKAETLGYTTAIARALEYGVPVQYDEVSEAPFIRYRNIDGVEHEIWFEDVRSMNAKFNLIEEYGFLGGGYWNLQRYFRANWLLQANRFLLG